MPSAPRTQPAWSRIWFALSTLNSHLVFFDWKRSGAFRKFDVLWPRRPMRCSWIDARSTSSESADRTAGSVRNGWVDFGLDRSPSTSVHGSLWLHWMKLTPLDGIVRMRPLVP